eukprot:124964_1
MDSIQTIVNTLNQMNKQERQKALHLLIKISNNIINNSNNEKFQNINFKKIKNKCPKIVPILLNIGFEVNPNGMQITFNKTKENALKLFSRHFTSLLNSNNISQLNTETFISVMETHNSNDVNQDQINYHDENTALKQLLSMGFDKNISLFALSNCNNDINSSVQFIIDQMSHTSETNKPNIDNDEHIKENEQCIHSVNNCMSTKRVGSIIKYHINCIYDYINGEYNDGIYSNTHLINDYHHLIFKHDSEFEHIYKIFVENTCNKSSC